MAILQVNVRPASLRPQGRARRRARAGESTANATQSESSRSHPDASSHGGASPQKSDSVPVPDKSVWQRITWKLMPATPVGRALVSATERLRDAGISTANLSILKTGKAKAIRFSTLEAICKELDCQPGDILEFSDSDVPDSSGA